MTLRCTSKISKEYVLFPSFVYSNSTWFQACTFCFQMYPRLSTILLYYYQFAISTSRHIWMLPHWSSPFWDLSSLLIGESDSRVIEPDNSENWTCVICGAKIMPDSPLLRLPKCIFIRHPLHSFMSISLVITLTYIADVLYLVDGLICLFHNADM